MAAPLLSRHRRFAHGGEYNCAEGTSWLLVINHPAAPGRLECRGHDLVTDREVTGQLVVPAGRVAVVRES
jgi:hypothetical protein